MRDTWVIVLVELAHVTLSVAERYTPVCPLPETSKLTHTQSSWLTYNAKKKKKTKNKYAVIVAPTMVWGNEKEIYNTISGFVI